MTKDIITSDNPLVEIGVDVGDKDECVITLPKEYGE